MKFCRLKALSYLIPAILFFCFAATVPAQSSDQNNATPITSNEIAATIKARDIGDARLTTHFYAFNGDQGDIFISVVTKNFTGDIDIFFAEGLRPVTKMVIYADGGVNETGRLIYLRKPEKLLLRIEGRPPGDDTAVYRIKFGGSFVAMTPKNKGADKATPKVFLDDDKSTKVNSVGTIIDPYAKPAEISKLPVKTPKTLTIPNKKPNLVGGPHLVIILKDGKRIEYPMSEVQSFTFDKGVLTVTDKDGLTEHFPMVNVVRFTIE